jgi:membrane protein YdbS with pleckstrin-like domain
MSSWHYFRKEAREGESPEIFTDVESKVAKYKRVLTYLAFFALIIIVVMSRNVWFEYPYSWWFIVRAMYLFLTVGLIYSIIKLLLRIRHLRRI